MFKKRIDEYGWDIYYIREKLPSGMMMEISFHEFETKKMLYFSITLIISHKRKAFNNQDLKITGKDGILGLLKAKGYIKEFEKFILEKYPDKKIMLEIYWDDNRRRNVYYRGLKNEGFYFDRNENNKVLQKNLN